VADNSLKEGTQQQRCVLGVHGRKKIGIPIPTNKKRKSNQAKVKETRDEWGA
jgi:hypothetical protein